MKHVHRAWRFARAYLGLNSLKLRAASLLDRPADLITLTFGFGGGVMRPVQVEEELANLLGIVRKLEPLTVLEIGTHKGGTLFLWTCFAKRNATIVSIDLPGGKFGGGYSRLRAALFRRFAKQKQSLHLLRADSHARQTFEVAKNLLGGSGVDLLFIDGDHTYDGVKMDWEMYSPLVREGGIVVFHDIAANYEDTQVKRLWDSIKVGFRHQEYVANPEGFYGIGVLFV
jgi:predicted O-methyltransferase YrrM